MNIFYTNPEKVFEAHFELADQEAQHVAKVLRLRKGDEIHATDGKGIRLVGNIQAIGKNSVTVFIKEKEEIPKPIPEKVLAMGIIKKRDRLEFAVEKAVELGATEIVLFDSDHSEKTKVREDRLQTIAISAMKQSMRSWLPEIVILKSLEAVLQKYADFKVLMAHEQVGFESGKADEFENLDEEKLLLLVGPEGGFSNQEVELAKSQNAELVSLGKYRLRAETAAVAFLSRFI